MFRKQKNQPAGRPERHALGGLTVALATRVVLRANAGNVADLDVSDLGANTNDLSDDLVADDLGVVDLAPTTADRVEVCEAAASAPFQEYHHCAWRCLPDAQIPAYMIYTSADASVSDGSADDRGSPYRALTLMSTSVSSHFFGS